MRDYFKTTLSLACSVKINLCEPINWQYGSNNELMGRAILDMALAQDLAQDHGLTPQQPYLSRLYNFSSQLLR